jgi:tetratricopeptide (TPR) repeat protein
VQRGDKAPRKIHLTSGALAQMYLKGKLYDQAIAELRAGIAKDPERLDLQVLLAQALWENHQEMNAGRIAAEVLNRLPYSIDANSILARLWLKHGRPAEARPFLERVSEVDPLEGYRVAHEGNEPSTDEFRMTMLDYSAAQHAAQSGAADWVSQISAIEKQKGVTGPLGAPKQSASITDIFLRPEPEPSSIGGGLDENVPDWLQSAIADSQAQGTPATSPFPSSATPSTPGGDAPDWLQEALGQTSDVPESLPPAIAAPEVPPLMDSGTPDWLREALGEAADAPSPVAPSGDTPDWLQEALGQENAPSESVPGEEPAPPWMQNALDQKPMFAPDEAGDVPTPAAEETPAWLQEIRASEPRSDTPDALRTDLEHVPDWLGEILSESPGAADASAQKPSEESVNEVSDEWLDDFLVGGPPMAGAAARTPSSLPASEPHDAEPIETRMLAPDEDAGELESWDAPPPASEDWLTQPTGIEAEAQPAKSAASEPESLPDWLQTDQPLSEDRLAPVSEAAGEDDALPDWLSAMPDTAPVMATKEPADQEAASKEEALPAWLSDVPETAPAMAEEEHGDQEAALPDWLTATDIVEADQQPEPVAQAEEPKELPAWLQGVEEDDEEQPDWLRALSAADAEEPESGWQEEPAAVQVETPASEEESQVVPPNDEPMGENDSSEIPDWMLDGDLDSDDAVAWLEDLAAKYDPEFKRESETDGEDAEAEPAEMDAIEMEAVEPATMTESASDEDVDEEEEDELAWLRSPTEDTEPIAEAESGADDALPSWLSADDDLEEEAEPAAAPSTEDALSWLDSQVTQQGVSTEAIVSEALTPDHPPTETAPPPPMDAEAEPAGDEDLPEWLRGEDVEAEIERAGSGSMDELTDLPELDVEDEELAWLDEALKVEEATVSDSEMESLMGETQGDDALPDWLTAMEQADEEEEAEPTSLMDDDEEAEEEAEPAPTVAMTEDESEPTSLMDDEEEEETEPTPAVAIVEDEEEALPAWLTEDSEEPATVEPPPPSKPPVVELPKESEPLPAWLQGTSEPSDAGLDEFLKAAVPAARESDRTPAPPPVAPPPPAPMVTGPLPTQVPAAPMPGGPAGPGLEAARSKMAEGFTDDSFSAYEALVSSRESLDEIVADLTEYTKGSRPNPRAHRIIGDALMAQGKLNDALAMYQKALDHF